MVRFFGHGALPLDLLMFLGFYLKGLLTCSWLEELLGEAFFKCLEFGTTLCDVDYLEGEK